MSNTKRSEKEIKPKPVAETAKGEEIGVDGSADETVDKSNNGSKTSPIDVRLEDEGSQYHAEGRGGKFNVRKEAGNYHVVNELGDTVRVYSKDDEIDNPEKQAQNYADKLASKRPE